MSDKITSHCDDDGEVVHKQHIACDEDEIERQNGQVLLAVDDEIDQDAVASGLKLAKDGNIILIPQPTDDPQDPLNWSSFKKHMILLCVSFGAFAGDFGLAAGIPTIVLQSKEWNISASKANLPNNLAVIMLGVSSLIWMPLVNFWGRIPVLFWSTVMGLFFTLGCVLAPNFTTFYAMRALQGVTQGTGSTIGLAFIKDMFFFHEHARKIGIWYALFICSPFASPLLGNFMVATLDGQWRPVFWLVFAWACFLAAMILVFGDETYYNRSVPLHQQPVRPTGHGHRLLRVVGIWQAQNHSQYFLGFIRSYSRLFEVFLKPLIPMAVLVYGATFMWSIGINQTSSLLLETPVAVGGYGMGPKGIGYIYFTPIVAVILGEAFGHYFNDYVVRFYSSRHRGTFVPEVRLWTTYGGVIFMIPGLVLVGETLQKHLPWVGIVFGWGMFQFGAMLVSVAMVAYVLDCYPTASGEVSAFVNFGRAACGFAVGYFQQPWGARQGYDVSFGLQAVIVAVAFLLLVCIQVFGARIRRWSGPVGHLKI
ncbi:MAG: hypothetical protein M1819_005889 [Sarea resinae]|nr:MAG: hypothetical protein M1819_005889 [Sarea resinae]